MRNRSNILDHGNLKACSLKCTDCSFTTGTGALYQNLEAELKAQEEARKEAERKAKEPMRL